MNPGKAFQLIDPLFSWTNGQSETITTDGRFGVAESGALTIDDAQPRDSNKYICRVSSADTEGSRVTRKGASFYHHLIGEWSRSYDALGKIMRLTSSTRRLVGKLEDKFIILFYATLASRVHN